MDVQTLYVGNDMLIEVAGLAEVLTGAAINDATVTVTLKTDAGVSVTGATWPLSMAYVANSSGIYRVTLPDTLSLTADASYIAHINADGGDGRMGHWERDIVAKTRK